MDFAAALYTFLTSHTGIAALVGDKVYPIRAPDSPTLPLLVFREMYTDHLHELQADNALIVPSYEIEAHAESHVAARALMRTVEAALKNYTGAMTTCQVQAVLMSGGAEDYEPEGGYFWRSKEFQFYVTEA